MAHAIVGGFPVPVAVGGSDEEAELIGDRDRMFDGSMREVSDGLKRRWPITTRPLSAANYATLRAILVGAPPIACSGDLFGGAVSCFVELGSAPPLKAGGALRRVLRFTLLEA